MAMQKCLFCDTELDANTKPEHILLNALGGRKTSRDLICSRHNETFGATIDRALAEQLPVVRNMLQLESGTGKMPPMLRNIQSGSDVFNIASDGAFEWRPEPIEIIDSPDGKKELRLQARSKEHLLSLVPHIAAKLGISEEKVISLMKEAGGTWTYRRPGPIRQTLVFGGHDAVRSMAKACLELWATVVGQEEVRSAAYDDARRFVLDGDLGFLDTRTAWDTRDLPSSAKLAEGFAPYFNLIYVRSDKTGRVIGHFTLYNLAAWQIVLAEHGGRAEIQAALVSNPLSPAVWSDRIADEVDLDFGWLTHPERDDGRRMKAVVGNMLQKRLQQSREREMERIAISVFAKHGIEELSIDTDASLRDAVIGEISARVTRHLMNIPEQIKLGPAEIDAMLRRTTNKDSDT